jgi:hypothetical protein
LLNDFGAAPSPEEVQRRLDRYFPTPSTQGELWADNRTPYQRYRSELANKMRYGSHSQRVAAINESLDNSWRDADISPGYRATIDLFRPQGYQPGIGGTSNFELIVQASLAGAAMAGRGAAPSTARLTQRADEVHSVLGHPAARNGRTTAVLETSGGDIVGGGVRDLSPAQRAALRPGEIASKIPGEHAEITALQEALNRGLKPRAIGTSRDFCPDCIKKLQEAGARITGPRTAVWD